MSKAVIYTTPTCPYCAQAKTLLDRIGIPYETIDISANNESRQEMVRLSGGRTTVPQIFIDGVHIGGFDDLYTMHQEGKLQNLGNA